MRTRTVQVFRVNGGRVLRPIEEITDRAKRYRANRDEVRPKSPKQCIYCGSSRNVGVDHIDGHETNDNPSNLAWACKSCNTRKGILFKKHGLGRRVTNPKKRGKGSVSMDQYAAAIKVMRGIFPGDVNAAVATIRATPAAMRSEYSARAWKMRRAVYGPSGRGTSGDVPF